jgi:hypothetical protein
MFNNFSYSLLLGEIGFNRPSVLLLYLYSMIIFAENGQENKRSTTTTSQRKKETKQQDETPI